MLMNLRIPRNIGPFLDLWSSSAERTWSGPSMSWTTASWTAAGSGWWRSPGTGARPGQGRGQSQAPGQGPGAGGVRLAGAGARAALGARTMRTDLAARARNHPADPDHELDRGFVVALYNVYLNILMSTNVFIAYCCVYAV